VHSYRMSLLILTATLGCSSPLAPSLEGTWGSEDVSLVLSTDGGRLAYPCGAGTISSGWRVTEEGSFVASGEHYFGGGPLPSTGWTPHQADYSGLIKSDRLTLTVVVDGNLTLGPFELRRGAPEVQERCL